MTEENKYWLAGLLEAEGYFGHPSTIRLGMTDKDTIEKALGILGSHHIHERMPKKENHKTLFSIHRTGEMAREVMSEILPLMGERRRKKICDILSVPDPGHHDMTGDPFKLHWLAGYLEGEGCFLHSPPRRPSSPRIMVWSTDYDVIKMASDVMGGSCILMSKRSDKWSVQFRTEIACGRAISIMEQIVGMMSERRAGRINEILSCYRPTTYQRNRSVLTDENIMSIVSSRRAGVPRKILSEKHSIPIHTIDSIMRGLSYSALTGIKKRSR